MRPICGPAEDEERDRNERTRHHPQLESNFRRQVRVTFEAWLDVLELVYDVEEVLQRRKKVSGATLDDRLRCARVANWTDVR